MFDFGNHIHGHYRRIEPIMTPEEVSAGNTALLGTVVLLICVLSFAVCYGRMAAA